MLEGDFQSDLSDAKVCYVAFARALSVPSGKSPATSAAPELQALFPAQEATAAQGFLISNAE